MAENTAHPPIIIRKKAAHAGHHGGAWKVAYADFVTAMMALFIVLWLLASSDQVKKAIAAYFLDPQGKKHDIGSGLAGTGESISLTKQDMPQLQAKLQKALLNKVPELKSLDKQISMTITGEGLRIELLESSKGCFFENGSARPTQAGIEVISALASELGKLPNRLLVEGHTDATPYQPGSDYSNWELSTDRANAARRLMQEHGVRADQVTQVRGYADQSLRDKANPLDPSNRRITVIVRYEHEINNASDKNTEESAGANPAAKPAERKADQSSAKTNSADAKSEKKS